MKENLLISSCLCGNNTTYKKTNKELKELSLLEEKYNLIKVCPELLGGLTVPRRSSEIKEMKVISNDLKDVTYNFKLGASKTLELCKKYNCKKALLKEKSPSCGVCYIYDGTFSGTLIEGNGLTTRLLKENDIDVYSDKSIDILLK